MEVQLSTDRDYRTETVILFRDNNFGECDVSRTISQGEAFLFANPPTAFDLSATSTQIPVQRRAGYIEAIRVDPLEAFVDVGGVPSDGTVQLDYIAIY